MTNAETLCEKWQEVRGGLMKEVELISADQFSFRATPESRSVIELLHHVIEAERVITGEACRENSDLSRASFPELIAEYAGETQKATTKEAILALLGSSLEGTKSAIRKLGDEKLQENMTRLDGKAMPRGELLNFIIAHEMYHRGQLTVYQRLLGIEPALTQLFRKMYSTST